MIQAFLHRYARGEEAVVLPFIAGRRVLDLGAGEGYVAAALVGHAWTCSVDIGPFRRAAVPYVTYDGARLPFADGAFDMTLISLALHHCSRSEGVLDEAVRVTRARLIVLESVYRNASERFWLELLDGRLTGLRHGGRTPAALAFRGPEEWQALFASRHLRTVAVRWFGPRWERLVHHPLLFVLDTPRQMSSSARATVSPKRPIAYGGRPR